MSRKIYNLGKVKGRTPEFRLTEKLLEIKYDDETIWSTLVDFSTIASSFDLRLNEETLFLEAKRDVNAEWEQVADLSELAKAHEHDNKDILDKITNSVFTNINDAISKKHKHENMSSLNQITDEHIQNINQIPAIQEEISQFAPPQLTEGVLYSDETKKGLSTNKDAVPTADYVWIEGEASKYHSLAELMSSATLKVVTTSGAKSTTTTVTINIVCADSDSASSVQTILNTSGYHIGVVFEDTPDKTFYIKVSSVSTSDTTVDVTFTFIDGQETFSITGNITRAIQSICVYPKNGIGSHNEGLETIAAGDYSHVQGKYNEVDNENKYAHIVGNGTSDESRSNAHTLDWEGNAWYAGSVEAHEVFAFDTDNLTRETVSPNLWNGSFIYLSPDLLQEGTQYIITMKGKEHRFTGTNLTSFTLDDYNINMWYAEDYWGEGRDTYQGTITPNPGYNEVVTLEKEVASYVDLLSYIKSVNDKFEIPIFELESLEIGAWKDASRTILLSDTIGSALEWYPLFPLEVGSWYAITIDGVESKVKCSSPDGLSALVGDFPFSIQKALFNGEHEMYVLNNDDSGVVKSLVIEKINLPRVDLMQYINDADAELLDKIESSALTEEQAQNISLNTEARHTHDNQSTLDKITEQTLTDIADNTESISTLTSDSKTEGSIEYKIAQAVSAIMENPDDTMNSIQELVTWCNDHAEDALTLTTQVATNKNDIASLKGLVGETDVATQITNAITEALKVNNVDKYALATDLSNAVTKILEVEQASHSHENKAVLDSISQSAHGNLQIGDALHWRVTNGSVIEGFETDEETGDLTLFIRVAPNPAIPATEIKIKQSYPEIWTAIEALQTELSGTTTTANEILETLGGAE